MRKSFHHAVLVLAFLLGACGSTPSFKTDTDPYWTDPQWVAALFKAVQTAVHYPVDTADQSVQSIHGEVQFTLADGKITDPKMVESTGSPELDRVMLQQVAAASAPK